MSRFTLIRPIVSPCQPKGGWYDYETASKQVFARRRGRCPNEGNACFCTGACMEPLEKQAWERELDYYRSKYKPRIRVKAGREVTP